MISPTARRLFATLLLLSGLLSLAGFLILPATGWPDIAQGMPVAEAFPQISAEWGAFRAGYAALALSGILFVPAAIYILQVVRPAGAAPLWLLVAAAFALTSGALRSLWYAASLTVVPTLERLWQGADAPTQAAVNVFYIGVNDLLSTVQEDIGVNFFGALFALIVGVVVLRRGGFPRWTGALAVLSSACYLISSSELIGLPNPGPIQVAGPVLSTIWLIALGVIELIRREPQPAAELSPASRAR
jgi:hypothetical protein